MITRSADSSNASRATYQRFRRRTRREVPLRPSMSRATIFRKPLPAPAPRFMGHGQLAGYNKVMIQLLEVDPTTLHSISSSSLLPLHIDYYLNVFPCCTRGSYNKSNSTYNDLTTLPYTGAQWFHHLHLQEFTSR